MEIICSQLNPKACKTYLVGVEGSKEAVLIDPVLEHVPEYLAAMRKNGYSLSHVVDTHTHADHISGAAALKDITGCEYLMHSSSPVICAQFRVDDGFEWRLFGKVPVRVLHTPGHTVDSLCLVFPGCIFTGDTLFLDEGGAGRDDLPGGDPAAHWDSLLRISRLPESLVVYPAHDYGGKKPSSLGRQKSANPVLQKRSRGEFEGYVKGLKGSPPGWMQDVLKANYACARDLRAAWIPMDSPSCEKGMESGKSVNEMAVSTIPPRVLKQKLGSPGTLVLLDVRESDELHGELGCMEGVVHIPLGSLVHRLDEIRSLRGSEVVVVCRSGARAYTAAQILAKAGFTRVSVLAGGMLAWRKEG